MAEWVKCACGKWVDASKATTCRLCGDAMCGECLQCAIVCESCAGITIRRNREKRMELRTFKPEDFNRTFVNAGAWLVIALGLWMLAALAFGILGW